MVKRQGLKVYSLSMEMLKKQCIEAGMSEAEFKRIYYEALNELQKESTALPPELTKRASRSDNVALKFTVLMIALAISYVVIYNSNVILSNLQEFIYPGLHTLRKLAIPIVSLFPAITGTYI